MDFSRKDVKLPGKQRMIPKGVKRFSGKIMRKITAPHIGRSVVRF
jgi:hypothetical protein